MTNRPVALSIAGFDCSAGAGLQADLKTFSALGVYGLTAVTCVVAETPNVVTRIDPVDGSMVAEQIRLLDASFPIAAVKTGMLYDVPQIEAVADALEGLGKSIVVDPVMIASTGDPLLKPEALSAFKNRVLPLATVITPNRAEAEFLSGTSIPDLETAKEVARDLAARFNCACVLKGGHLDSEHGATDVLATSSDVTILEGPWIDLPSAHGTGCTFAAALTASLAKGENVQTATRTAKSFVTAALKNANCWNDGQLITLDQTRFPAS